jgi:hypothetical protein
MRLPERIMGCVYLSWSFFWGLLFVGGYLGGILYGLYSVTKGIDELRHVQSANCTIMDAQIVSDSDSGDSWAIHVNFTIPAAYYYHHHTQPIPNITHVTLLLGTNANAHYFVNETLPCFVSLRNLDTVSLSRQAADGWTIFGLLVLIALAMPIALGVIGGLVLVGEVVRQVFVHAYELVGRWSTRLKGAKVKKVKLPPSETAKSVILDTILRDDHKLEAGTHKEDEKGGSL